MRREKWILQLHFKLWLHLRSTRGVRTTEGVEPGGESRQGKRLGKGTAGDS